MALSSLVFLFAFLPGFLLIYAITPSRFKNHAALVASLIFYAWGAPRFAGLLLATSILDYVLCNAIFAHADRPHLRRGLLLASIAVNVGLLLYFKYAGFFVAQANSVLALFTVSPVRWTRVAMPLGISFITFQRLCYVIDVYWKRVAPAPSLASYLLYILLFPKLTQGPIVRFGLIASQLAGRVHSLDAITSGIFRFTVGLAKKALIADTMGEVADRVFQMGAGSVSMPYAWLGALCYAFQIYFDFSGYTDMAIGVGKLLGFQLPENFDRPYLAQSITEFWRRWHITLSNWLRDYLFLPISFALMRRVERDRIWFVRTDSLAYATATLATMFLAGLWHGANWTFVVWGVYHGVFLVIDKLFWLKRSRRLPKLAKIPLTFLIVLFGWVLFRSDSIALALSFVGHMFNISALHSSTMWVDVASVRALSIVVLALLLCFVPAILPWTRLSPAFDRWASGPAMIGLRFVASVVLFFVCVCTLTNTAFHPFIYWKF
ncbi:MAG: MBOAT family O-acyltransferase [Acidobacteriota bacterium]